MKCDWCNKEVEKLYKKLYRSFEFECLGVSEIEICKECEVVFKSLMKLSNYDNLGHSDNNEEDTQGG